LATRFRNSSHRTLGIICKTSSQAKRLSEILKSNDVSLLTPESTSFREGVVITTIPLAKGLEFDEVIIPYASADYYQTELDRSLLYIACTRAMHQLTLTYTKERSRFLL
jgi:DNA helicase-2/ATP-dependent DNA helicase PcrA